MKIRNKIALTFTMITACLLLIIFLFIYYFANRYTENEFYLRLKERANIAAQILLEKDELSSNIYNEIRDRYFKKLTDEEEHIFKVDIIKQSIANDLEVVFPSQFLQQIFKDHYAEIKIGKRYHAGMLYADNEGDFMVIISAFDPYGQAKINNLRNILSIMFLLSLGVIYILGRYHAKQTLLPISDISKKANTIRASNLHLRLETGNKKDELGEFAQTFNSMLDRLETSFEIQNNFINNASHELKNPLTAILGEAEVALRNVRSPDEYIDSLSAIQKEAQRLELLVNNLLKLAQTDFDNKGLIIESIRIDELMMEVKNDIDQLNPDNKITFDFTGFPQQSDALIIHGSVGLLKVVFTNIVDNACKFSMNKPVIIKISVAEKTVEISIKDKGVGIPASELSNIAEPFYRASNVRGYKGFGVGLSLAQKIIKLHGGTMDISSKVANGTQVIITLPNQNQPVSITR